MARLNLKKSELWFACPAPPLSGLKGATGANSCTRVYARLLPFSTSAEMGCCESRHDPSLLQASRPDSFRGGIEDGGSSLQAVERG